MKDTILDRIKRDIFVPITKYKKDFPEFIIPQFFLQHNINSKSKISNSISDSSRANKNLLILVYIPFCPYQCIFCRNKYFAPKKNLIKKYVDYLIKEINLYAQSDYFQKNKIKAIYLGGGTPTVLSFVDINRISKSIRKNFQVTKNPSITCETHPVFLKGQQGKINLQKLTDCGINRISIGAQSFDDKILKLNRRGHTKKDVFEAVNNANKKNVFISLDMMFGLPGQDIESIKKDLVQLEQLQFNWVEYMRHDIVNDKAIKILDENPELLINKDELFEINMMVQTWLEQGSYERNGCFSKNSKSFPYRAYWLTETPYIAFGPVAHSHLGGICYYNQSKIEDYFDSIEKNELPINRYQILSPNEQVFRSLFLGLQTKTGVSIRELKSRFGEKCYNILSETISVLKSHRLIEEKEGYLRLTQNYGRYFVEDISCFIVDKAKKTLNKG